MKARRLIDGAALGPATLKAMGEAFDQAWAQIAGNFGDSPLEIESAGLRLAEAMLSITTEDSTDVAVLKAGALQAMAMDYAPAFSPQSKTKLRLHTASVSAFHLTRRAHRAGHHLQHRLSRRQSLSPSGTVADV
jgi:hypothetical protein